MVILTWAVQHSFIGKCEEGPLDDLTSCRLNFTSHRTSDRRSQAAAGLDVIVQALDKRDEEDQIPLVYCEAADLVKMPPISADFISEVIQGNKISSVKIESCLSDLQSEFFMVRCQISTVSQG